MKHAKNPTPIDRLLAYLIVMGKRCGTKLVYAALLLFYAYQEKETPKFAKHVILGAISYLLSPIDAIPDLTPVLGFTDDLSVLSYALVTIACYINDDVRQNAKDRMHKWFKNLDNEILETVDETL